MSYCHPMSPTVSFPALYSAALMWPHTKGREAGSTLLEVVAKSGVRRMVMIYPQQHWVDSEKPLADLFSYCWADRCSV